MNLPKAKTLTLTGFNNSDTSKYYVSTTGIKTLLGANTVYSATLSNWSGFGCVISLGYANSSDTLYVMFETGKTLYNAYLEVTFTYI